MDVGLERVDRQTAPVRVVAPLEIRLLVVLLGLHDLRDMGVAAVSADHDARPLDHRGAACITPTDANDDAVLDDHVFDGEAFADLGARGGGGVDEDLVDQRAPRRVPARCRPTAGGCRRW